MKISVEIDEKTVEALMMITGETKKGPAIAKAASEMVRKARLKKFAQLVMEGEFKDTFDPDYHPDRFPSLTDQP